MRTMNKRAKLDRRFRRINKAARWLYKHHLIPKTIKNMIIDFVDNKWSESYH